MPLGLVLTTNEVKNAAGTEVEFSRCKSDGSAIEFRAVAEAPAYPHRLDVAHTEKGEGVLKRRRSKIGVKKTIAGQVDTTRAETILFYIVADIPVGNLTATTEAANVLAELMSFVASTGADTTIKYDGSGTGGAVLLSGDA